MFKNENFYILSLIPILLIALLVIYFIGRSTGKAKANKEAKTPPVVNYPHGGMGIPAGWSPEALANKLYENMQGISLNKIKQDAIFKEFLLLPTDDMFIAVYDVFNQKYHTVKNGTLRKWIEDEKYLGFPDIIRPLVYKRMDLLNLT